MTKKLVLGLFALVFTGSLAFAETNAELMKKVADSHISTFNLPEGYTAEDVAKPRVARTNFAKRLNQLTRQKYKDWKELILESEEYEDWTPEEKARVARDPKGYLEVPYLLEIQENRGDIQAVKKDGVIIGYIIQVADHVQAAIYQDGAWITFYMDDKLKVVAEEEGSA